MRSRQQLLAHKHLIIAKSFGKEYSRHVDRAAIWEIIAQAVIQQTRLHLPIAILLISHKTQHSNVNNSSPNKKRFTEYRQERGHDIQCPAMEMWPNQQRNSLDFCWSNWCFSKFHKWHKFSSATTSITTTTLYWDKVQHIKAMKLQRFTNKC